MLPITIQANPHLKSWASRVVPLKLVGLITILLSSVSIVQPAFFNSFTCEKRPTYILSVIVEVSSAFVHTTVNICCKSVGKEGYISITTSIALSLVGLISYILWFLIFINPPIFLITVKTSSKYLLSTLVKVILEVGWASPSNK